MSVDTDTPEEAAAHIRRTWDRRVSPPTIEGASLTGVGRLSVKMGASVPVLRYRDSEGGGEILAFAFNYALMDTLGEQATLDRERRAKLAANRGLLSQQRRNRAVVLWRQRDDIFVIVAPDISTSTLRSRIQL
jgi:hypothetical protein